MEVVIMFLFRCIGYRGELIDDKRIRRKKNIKRK